jgi:hypothetical protein
LTDGLYAAAIPPTGGMAGLNPFFHSFSIQGPVIKMLDSQCIVLIALGFLFQNETVRCVRLVHFATLKLV